MVGVPGTDCRARPGNPAESSAIELIPAGADQEFLASVNRCFGAGWGDGVHRWYLGREFAGRTPDLLVLRERGRAVAGMGLNYRLLRLATGSRLEVGIITSAWTLPESRGRGCFQALVRGSVPMAARKGCALLVAFGATENASARVFRRCGATLFPTAYLGAAPGEEPPSPHDGSRELREVDVAEIEASSTATGLGSATRFVYPDAAAWRSQYLRRPYPVQTLRAGESRIIVEQAGDTDRLVLLIGPPSERRSVLAALASRARRAGRGFFVFTTDPSDGVIAQEAGWESKAGYLAALALGEAKAADGLGPWEVQPGDRM